MLVVIVTGSSEEPMQLENTWTTCDSHPDKSHLIPRHHKSPKTPKSRIGLCSEYLYSVF
jgi:hypothetical protein